MTPKSRRTVRTFIVQIFRAKSIALIENEVDSLIIEFCKAKWEQPPNTSDKPESQLIDNTSKKKLLIEIIYISMSDTTLYT